ncbi:hypothetical protein CHS0354_001463 [Potamilus streckersoni]|uniref:Ammonium transporter AmtB-like domain-containing protein n=1 Tax=Potamilus streckersoni TaxID=2493646 RepID=A0AAE0T8Q2_9BIVA|nr:hypothetical protein CHS0354_001463 [Potamilus streckersoni]
MSYLTGGKFFVFCMLLEAAFIVIFARLADYGDSARPIQPKVSKVGHVYPSFQDVHVMIFIGFGFLMTFLKRYGYTAVGVNMLIGSFVIQWALIVRGLIRNKVLEGAKFHINVEEMLAADFASGTCLISFGAVLGKTSPLQLLIMALIEVALAQTNKHICEEILHAADAGESMYIHAFGAYFGLAAARVLYRKDAKECEKNGPVYNSDLFSMIGTIFLWMYWPSFNSGSFEGDEQHRAIINTYLSLTACTVVTFAFSGLLHKGKFEMVHVQNATLAGGVAVGTTAHMVLHPWGALLMGLAAGMLSTLGFHFIQPFLLKYLRIHDTCGVNNLHGMPGILAGVAGSIVAALASADVWGNSRFDVFPQMVPPANTTELESLNSNSVTNYTAGLGRSAGEQGAYQIAALGVTLAMAIGSGIFTGLVLKIPIFNEPQEHELFDDHHWWNVPSGIPGDKGETVVDSGEMKIFKKTEESNVF